MESNFVVNQSDNDAVFSETLVMWEKNARPAPENEGLVVIPEVVSLVLS